MTAKKLITTLIMLSIIIWGPGTYNVQAQASESIIPAIEEKYSEPAPFVNQLDKPLKLFLDNSEFSWQLTPIINSSGRMLIAIDDVTRLFSCVFDFVDSNQVIMSKDQLQLSFRINEYTCLKNNDLCYLDTRPEMWGEVFFLPLRFIAEQLGYQLYYQADFNQITLFSPAEQIRGESNSVPPAQPADPIMAQPILPPPDNLPPWGSLLSAPALGARWQGQKILGGYYTSLENSPEGRNTNITLSCQKINEKVLNPGEVFSFNQVVGERTPQAGYQLAKIFVGKNIVSGIGGGICQTASTLYNCALETGMPVVERHPHTIKVTYVPNNRDATVSWGGADFKFRNNQNFPVKILIQSYGDYLLSAIVAAI